ncbi:MAG TPA: hypothetical protein VKU02_33740 [Gemmataceae bacterium]|nr:hypothetical protein [Gemmataceae bacterium]
MMSMHWFGRRVIFLSLVLPLLSATLAAAEDSPLGQLPAGAPLVIQIHGVQHTKDRLMTLVKNALPELAPQLQAKIEDNLKQKLHGRKLEGLAPAGPDFVVFTALPESSEQRGLKLAYLARVSNYTAFRDGLLKPGERKVLTKDPAGYEVTTVDNGEKFYIFERHGYAVFTSHKEVADQFVHTSSGLKLSGELATELLQPDIAVYIDLAAVNRKYGDQIKSGRQFIEQLFGPNSPWMKQQAKANLQILQTMIGALFQATADSRAAVAGVEFRTDGLALHTQVDVSANTKTDQYLKNFSLASGSDLATLPAQQMGYWTIKLGPDSLKASAWMKTMILGSGAQAKAVQEAFDQLIAAKPHAFLEAFRLPPSGLKIAHFEDPAKAAAAMRHLFEAFEVGENFASAPIKGKPELKLDAQMHRGFRLDYASFTWDLDKLLATYEGPEESKKQFRTTMEQMLGKGIKVWFGTNGKINVQVIASDWPTAQRELDRYLDGKDTLGQQPAYAETRKNLPAEATAIALLDVSQYLHHVLEPFLTTYLKKQASGGATPALPVGSGKASFLGFAVQLQAEQGGFHLWLPGTAIGDVYKTYAPLIQSAHRQ